MNTCFLKMLLMPVLMLGMGLLIRQWTPKSVNCLFGYRTRQSTKNNETWTFANAIMATIWIRCGIFLLITSLLITVLAKEETVRERLTVIVPLLQLIPMFLSIIPVERSLKRHLDEHGVRRDE